MRGQLKRSDWKAEDQLSLQFTDHARDRVRVRTISVSEIRFTLLHGRSLLSSHAHRKYHSLGCKVRTSGRLIVVYKECTSSILIVTAYWNESRSKKRRPHRAGGVLPTLGVCGRLPLRTSARRRALYLQDYA